jgi:hypothetical protein
VEETMRRNIILAVTLLALSACAQGNPSSPPMTREDIRQRQLDLDVAAIVRGMALAHGAQVVASAPKP